MREHELKTLSGYFGAVLDGRKTFEVRRDDRQFAVGDTPRLREWVEDHAAHEDRMPGDYTGRETRVRVTFLLRDTAELPDPMLQPGYVVLGIEPVDR